MPARIVARACLESEFLSVLTKTGSERDEACASPDVTMGETYETSCFGPHLFGRGCFFLRMACAAQVRVGKKALMAASTVLQSSPPLFPDADDA
eukprot:5459052-Pleurochrysis_carterae.AAC.1